MVVVSLEGYSKRVFVVFLQILVAWCPHYFVNRVLRSLRLHQSRISASIG